MATGTITKDIKLLWTNPNPASAFVGQTISLDLSKYRFVDVILKTNVSSTNYCIHRALVSSAGSKCFCCEPIPTNIGRVDSRDRNFTATPTGIKFDNGREQTTSTITVNNNYMVPTAIYGIQ